MLINYCARGFWCRAQTVIYSIYDHVECRVFSDRDDLRRSVPRDNKGVSRAQLLGITVKKRASVVQRKSG